MSCLKEGLSISPRGKKKRAREKRSQRGAGLQEKEGGGERTFLGLLGDIFFHENKKGHQEFSSKKKKRSPIRSSIE